MHYSKVIELGKIIYDREAVEKAADVANGLIKAIKEGQYRKGWRNDIAVDLCCSMWILKYNKEDPELVACRLEEEGYLTANESENLVARIKVVEGYYDSWFVDWEDYWLIPEEWEKWNQNSTQSGYFDVKYMMD